jgi:hypothetical protein
MLSLSSPLTSFLACVLPTVRDTLLVPKIWPTNSRSSCSAARPVPFCWRKMLDSGHGKVAPIDLRALCKWCYISRFEDKRGYSLPFGNQSHFCELHQSWCSRTEQVLCESLGEKCFSVATELLGNPGPSKGISDEPMGFERWPSKPLET